MPPAAANSTLNAQADQLKRVNEQLRREVRLNRHKLGECAQDIIAYCEKEIKSDPLIVKVPASENPYRERNRSCLLF